VASEGASSKLPDHSQDISVCWATDVASPYLVGFFGKGLFKQEIGCFLAYWISARLAVAWRASGETGEVTHILRELQTIRLGQISLGTSGTPLLARLTKVPAHLNSLLSKLKLLPLFATPPKWAAFPGQAQM